MTLDGGSKGTHLAHSRKGFQQLHRMGRWRRREAKLPGTHRIERLNQAAQTTQPLVRAGHKPAQMTIKDLNNRKMVAEKKKKKGQKTKKNVVSSFHRRWWAHKSPRSPATSHAVREHNAGHAAGSRRH